ncbi:endonuclease MutS2 [Chloroflexota bacterium]
MDKKSLEMLEYSKVREILASFTSFPISRELAMDIEPSPVMEQVSYLLRQSAEARQLLSLNPNFSIGNINDIRTTIAMAEKEKTLDPQSLLQIRATIAATNELRASISRISSEFQILWGVTKQIVALPEVVHEIDRCIDDSGEILDLASPDLANIRYQLKETRLQLLNRLENHVKTLGAQNLLQDTIITERSGRYVIPVKIEMQHEVQGIIHDVSNTGATVFIEPWAIVELGNKLRQAALEEERELNRILTELSAEVGSNGTDIARNIDISAEIDLAIAKARYARAVNACEPLISPINSTVRYSLKLIEARHPLLKQQAVPISVEIGQDFSSLVITGPNTGGKTVTLKTIGLMVLMTQSGIPIPASEDSCLPVFDDVFADIGDEQSIEQTLSTFSWHMGNIVRIIRISTPRSLVLLDELGGSTDPTEGAALARSILLHFLEKRTLTVATTHYSELKIFAHATKEIQNASLEFDSNTLKPTYHLTLGIPGGSNALAIASQLGLSQEIVESAREMLPKGAQEVEQLLTDLTNEKQLTRTLREKIEKENIEIAGIRDELETELKNVQEQKQSILREARESISKEAAILQRKIREATSELKKAKSKESIEQFKRELNSVHQQLASESWQPEKVHGEITTTIESIAKGDTVRVIDTNLRGTILSISDKGDQVEIQVGRTRVKVGLMDVEKVDVPKETTPQRSFEVTRKKENQRRSIELDLRGKRAEEVEPELDSYLNDVSLAGFHEVRIIHGYGTGTVRQIVREMLASYPLVKSFRSGELGEGGDGVTIVKM